ncbi:universal stress protein [Cohnella silvisoli]|uniref:Universal stress protein n=1 Tax=Cohnella silvisoli TaxID=2873699 RepID=A0ABV1KM68_9BACL|nr:universal stress protein [Cohnella silvisoli]MCD9020489.1 universal stress protein [Cohnella silvisoli]
MTFQSILLAYDGSDTSRKAAVAASELADRFHSKVEAIHVMQPPAPTAMLELTIPTTLDVQEQWKDQARRLLDEAQHLLGKSNDPLTTLLEGSPGPSIVEYAARINSEMIIVGHRGLNRLEEILIGSVSLYVIRHAHCPVMTIKD